MVLTGTFGAIRDWATTTISAVVTPVKVWGYFRKIRKTDELIADFGTGSNNAQGEPITKGWMVNVDSREAIEQTGKSVVWLYNVNYICLWSLEDKGANLPDFVAHVEAVADALMAEARPTTLAALDTSSNVITFPVAIGEVYTVVFPIDSGRIHLRADLSQGIRLRQAIRS